MGKACIDDGRSALEESACDICTGLPLLKREMTPAFSPNLATKYQKTRHDLHSRLAFQVKNRSSVDYELAAYTAIVNSSLSYTIISSLLY